MEHLKRELALEEIGEAVQCGQNGRRVCAGVCVGVDGGLGRSVRQRDRDSRQACY